MIWNNTKGFPPSLITYLGSVGAFSPGSSTVPVWSEDCKLSFVDSYVRLVKKAHHKKQQPMYPLGSSEIQSHPFAVWTGGTSGGREVIMVFGKWSAADVLRLSQHYSLRRRWERLVACHEWIYHDLFTVLSDWVNIRNAAARELRDRSIEVNQETFTGNVLQRMRRLNRAMATNILLRESLLIQQSSLKEIIALASERYTEFRGLGEDAAEISFISRCIQVDKTLSHDLSVIQGILEQLQNLMTMIISVEQISTGQSVARLTYLGFVFLPLSFVAAIFGITTFTASPKWYPVGAVSALLVTIIVALCTPYLLSAWSSKSATLGGYLSRAKEPEYLDVAERGRSLSRVASSRGSEILYTRRDGSWPRSGVDGSYGLSVPIFSEALHLDKPDTVVLPAILVANNGSKSPERVRLSSTKTAHTV